MEKLVQIMQQRSMICAKSIQIAILNGNANNNVFRIQWEGNVKNKVPFMIFVQVLFVK